MGCDIHLCVEIKIDDQWHAYNHPSIERNYALFAKMAGVRNNGGIEPIAAPRGFPADASFVCKLDYERRGCDVHSASYLGESEIGLLNEWMRQQEWGKELFSFSERFGWLYGNSHYNLTKYKADYPHWLQDVRFVFWFDN